MRLAPRYKQNNTKSSSKGMYYYYKRQNYSGDSGSADFPGWQAFF